VEEKSNFVLRSQIGLQLWKIWTQRWKLIKLGKLLERISKLQPKNLGYFELKKHKQWSDEGCSKLLDQRKEAKLQWLQDPSEINGNNLNMRHEGSRHFRNKKTEYLKDKSNELAMNSKIKNIKDLNREINEFKTGYQPRNNLVKDENDDLLIDAHNI
jgi:hypothetical protein